MRCHKRFDAGKQENREGEADLWVRRWMGEEKWTRLLVLAKTARRPEKTMARLVLREELKRVKNAARLGRRSSSAPGGVNLMGEVRVETIATTQGPRHVDAERRGGFLIHTPFTWCPDPGEVTVTHAASGKVVIPRIRRAIADQTIALLERSGAPWDGEEHALILWAKTRPWWVEFLGALRGGHLKTAQEMLNEMAAP